MVIYKIPKIKEILKPRWSHKPGFGMKKAYVLTKRKVLEQGTTPEDPKLLKKLGIKENERVLAIAGYYASWASELAKAGTKVDYSDISRSMVNWSKKKYGNLFEKYLCKNYELIPENLEEYDWTFTFEACGGGSGLPLAYLRSLLNKKGGILIYQKRYGKDKKSSGGKPRTYPLIVKTLSRIYGVKYKIKEIKFKAHGMYTPTAIMAHQVHIIRTNKKARQLVQQDLDALFNNRFSKENLKRLSKISKILYPKYVKEVKLR